MPQVLPLSANRVTREGSGHLAMPPCGLPMAHQPIRFHIVLDEALRVARGRKKGKHRERRNGGGCLIRCYWSIAIDRVSAWWQFFQSWTHLCPIVFLCSALRQLLVYLSHWGIFTAMLISQSRIISHLWKDTDVQTNSPPLIQHSSHTSNFTREK